MNDVHRQVQESQATLWILLRAGKRGDGAPVTFGRIVFTGRVLVVTGELPWLHNQHGRSCIYDGLYEAVRHPSHPKEKIRLQNAPRRDDLRGRDGINIEIANWPIGKPGNPPGKPESKGCIFPGEHYGSDGLSVADSRPAMARLIEEAERAWAVGRLYIRIRWEGEQ